MSTELISWEQYLRRGALHRQVIDDFLHRPNWARFDSELGYVLNDSMVPWGLDGSRTIETFQAHGARSAILYAGRRPRLNTYGNSFTECNQVSDGETWQEYLAGHFGEPIGNFGIGGYGVYQSYRRLRREEDSTHGAPYVILYIWGDDPTRSLMRARFGAIYPWFEDPQIKRRVLFHGNPWAHLEMDLSTGRFIEKENLLSTPESLYKMTDPEWLLEHLGGDLAVRLSVYAGDPDHGTPGKIHDIDEDEVEKLGALLGVDVPWSSGTDRRSQAFQLLNLYGQRATNFILDQARAYAQARGKKLLIVLNYTARPDAFRVCAVPFDGRRRDQLILEHLEQNGFDYFDMNRVHQQEYELSNGGSYSQYMSRFHVKGAGHYNPRGNHFFAYAIKDRLIEWLDPKPVPYQGIEEEAINFSGYLPGTHSRAEL